MMGMKVYGFAIAAVCAALLAGVVITLEYSNTPSNIRLGLAEDFLFLGNTTAPVMPRGSSAASHVLGQGLLSSLRLLGVVGTKLGDANIVHPELDFYQFTTTALTNVFALILSNPLVNSTVVGATVVSGVWVSFPIVHRLFHGIAFNRVCQEKWGELLETLPRSGEGNQQPSAANGYAIVAVKVQRLAGEDSRPISLPRAPHTKVMI